MSQLHVLIPLEIKKQIKIRSVDKGVTLAQLITEALEAEIKRQ